MATYFGVNATKRDVTIPSVKINSVEDGGKVAHYYDEFNLTADLALNDVINLFKLPAGCKVLELAIDSADLDSGTTGLVRVGWTANGVDAANDAGFLTDVDVHTAAKVQKMSDLPAATVAGKQKIFTAETQVQAKISGDTNLTSGKIMVWALVARAN